MDKLRSLYSSIFNWNFAHLLVLGLVIKALVSDISIAAFLLSIPILSFEAYKLYLKHKKPDPVAINAEILSELDKLKSKINAGQFQKGIEPASPAKRYF